MQKLGVHVMHMQFKCFHRMVAYAVLHMSIVFMMLHQHTLCLLVLYNVYSYWQGILCWKAAYSNNACVTICQSATCCYLHWHVWSWPVIWIKVMSHREVSQRQSSLVVCVCTNTNKYAMWTVYCYACTCIHKYCMHCGYNMHTDMYAFNSVQVHGILCHVLAQC